MSGSKDTNIVVWDIVAECGLYRLHGHKVLELYNLPLVILAVICFNNIPLVYNENNFFFLLIKCSMEIRLSIPDPLYTQWQSAVLENGIFALKFLVSWTHFMLIGSLLYF